MNDKLGDVVIELRGELAAVRAQLDAANEHSRAMAAELDRLERENAAQAVALWKQNHELDALRNTPRRLTLTDRGDAGDEYSVAYDWDGR